MLILIKKLGGLNCVSNHKRKEKVQSIGKFLKNNQFRRNWRDYGRKIEVFYSTHIGKPAHIQYEVHTKFVSPHFKLIYSIDC